jgi:ferredoxin
LVRVKVSVDTEKCIGSGTCVLTCSEAFDQDDDGTVVLVAAAPPEGLRERVQAAVDACPTLAISLSE